MTQYLILHKVRGEPAFDVAEKAQIGDEEGWVLCTCGHRAYPYWYKPIDEIGGHWINPPPMPDEWPDHYTPKPEKKVDLNISELFSGMFPKFRRRI